MTTDEEFIADYNALIAKHNRIVTSCGHCPDAISEVKPGCGVKLDRNELVYMDEYGLDQWQRDAIDFVKEKAPHLHSSESPRGLEALVTMGFLDPPPEGGDGHHALTAKSKEMMKAKAAEYARVIADANARRKVK